MLKSWRKDGVKAGSEVVPFSVDIGDFGLSYPCPPPSLLVTLCPL